MEEEKLNQTEKKKEPEKEPEKIKEIHHHHYKKDSFNFGRLFLGIIVIIAGVIILGKNMGWFKINFDWWQLWPVIIIAIGLSMLGKSGWMTWLFGFLVLIIVLGIVAYLIFWGDSNSLNSEALVQPVTAVLAENINSAQININTGAGSLKIEGNEQAALIDGSVRSNFINLTKTDETKDGVQNVTLKSNGNSNWLSGRKVNEWNLKLNNKILTNLDINTGAVDMEIDLTEVMAQSIDIDTGASSLDITLGDLVDNAKLDIDAGASSINIVLPMTVGAKVTVDADLSSKDLVDFNKVDEKNYQSNNYDQSQKKVEIDLDLGVSSLNINHQ